jgi:hypothetical protein
LPTQQIQSKAEELEYGVFVSQTTNNKEEYFGALIEHNSPNPYVQQEISHTVQQTHRLVQKDIHRNNLDMSDRVRPHPQRSFPRARGTSGSWKTRTSTASSSSSRAR